MFGALLLFEDEFIHVVSISFTALIITELLMVALTIRTFHWLMGAAILASFGIYALSLYVLQDYFGNEDRSILIMTIINNFLLFFVDASFILSWQFTWKTLLITAVSCVPLYFLKFLRKKLMTPTYQKLS